MSALPDWTEAGPVWWDSPVREAAAKALALAMSDISEEAWCAGWLIELEFQLWDDVVAGKPVELRGAPFVPVVLDAATLADLRSLARVAGGWVARVDREEGPCARGDECGCENEYGPCANFVPWDEWAKMLEERR